MNIVEWFEEWADQCKKNRFGLIESKIREAVAAIKSLEKANNQAEDTLEEIHAWLSRCPTQSGNIYGHGTREMKDSVNQALTQLQHPPSKPQSLPPHDQ